MPSAAVLLQPPQLHLLLRRLSLVPAEASPLAQVPATPPLVEDDEGFEALVRRAVVERTDGGWRVNRLVAGALGAAARPDEVTWLRVMGERRPAFAICRRGALRVECTPGPLGLVKLAFPLQRDLVMLALAGALSSDRPDAPPSGFRFRGSVADAFVLRRLVERAPRDGTGSVDRDVLAEDVRASVDHPGRALPFAPISGMAPLVTLLRSEDALDASLARLVAAGHAVRDGHDLRPSDAARAALAEPPRAGFTLSRTRVTDDADLRASLQAMRCGDRTIVFRHGGRGPDAWFDWSEVTRAELRALVAAMLLDDEALTAAAAERA